MKSGQIKKVQVQVRCVMIELKSLFSISLWDTIPGVSGEV